jgi:hypothetical protein
MHSTPNFRVEPYRVRHGEMASDTSDGNCGAFFFPANMTPLGTDLHVLISDQGDWDHVSVSCAQRNPTWTEMVWLKRLFFRDDECVVQYHPAEEVYVNNYEFCLHLWRPQHAQLPLPPRGFV